MSGPLLATQETVRARVQTLGPQAAKRLMDSAVVIRRGSVQGITLVVGLLEPNSYLVARMPERTVRQLMERLNQLTPEQRLDSARRWVSENINALLSQYRDADSPRAGFAFRPVALQEAAQKPPLTAQVPQRTPRDERPPESTVPEPAVSAPGQGQMQDVMAPSFQGGQGTTRANPYQIRIPVWSRRRPDFRLGTQQMFVRLTAGSSFFPVYFQFNFVATKGGGQTDAKSLVYAIARIMKEKADAQTELTTFSIFRFRVLAYRELRNAFIAALKNNPNSDLVRYLDWSRYNTEPQ